MNIVVLSGGTATNVLVPCLSNLAKDISYILPISDNGGSTSEILRVLGGPAIGDIRSRIVRLINDPQLAVFFSYRLPNDPVQAKAEWNLIVEGTHPIWKDIPSQVKEMCRSFIIHIQAELLKKSRYSSHFQFEKASIGNLFLTGARLFLGSLDAAIELMLRICRCDEHVSVIPCINTNHLHHISALLTNGDVITGQSQISHPSKNSSPMRNTAYSTANDSNTLLVGPENFVHLEDLEEEEEEEEYAYPTYIHPELKNSQLHFDKLDINEEQLLPAPIRKIFYINPYGEEIHPSGNARAVSKIKSSHLLVYSIGSLMTSLLPIVILGNIAETVLEAPKSTRKVLLMNSKYDRETFGMDGFQYVHMIIESMTRAVIHNRRRRRYSNDEQQFPWNKFITDIIYLTKGQIPVDTKSLNVHGIRCHPVESDTFDNNQLEKILQTL